MDKQQLRNALSEVEDVARSRRKRPPGTLAEAELWDTIARLAQLVRQEIVK